MSDTPETDDAQWGTGKVTTDFARRLERERDEAREELKGWELNWYCAIGMAPLAQHELEAAQHELEAAK